jgi:hypothetical protein
MMTEIISMWRPWADWVMLGWKPIETRTHARFAKLAGKRIGIHAAKHWDGNALDLAAPYLTPDQIRHTCQVLTKEPSGVLLGTVFVEQHRLLGVGDSWGALIECETRRFGLIVSVPIRLAIPLPMRGHQGIWKVELF